MEEKNNPKTSQRRQVGDHCECSCQSSFLPAYAATEACLHGQKLTPLPIDGRWITTTLLVGQSLVW